MEERRDTKGVVVPIAASLRPLPTPTSPPSLPPICWRPGFLDFKDAYTRATEACDEFIFGAYLSLVGFALGRMAWAGTNTTRTFANTYITFVGMSGRSRKSTAQRLALDAQSRIGMSFSVLAGISSPEGVLGKLQSHPTTLLYIPELTVLLRKGKQEGSRGLIPTLTALYDLNERYDHPTRQQPIEVKNPFFSLLTASTPEWLKNSMEVDDVQGGFAGRIQVLVGTEKDPIALPPDPESAALERADKMLVRLRAAHQKEVVRYTITPEAEPIWQAWYERNYRVHAPNDLLDVLSQRLHHHALKMAFLYAALDESKGRIEPEHIEAGCAYADYQRQAQEFVFTDLDSTKEMKQERSVLQLILERPFQLKAYEIHRLRPRIGSEALNRILANLSRMCLITTNPKGQWGPMPGTVP